MKLLFDQNLSFKLCAALDDLFPGSSQVRLLGLDRADDAAILAFASQEGFTLVTLDTDFRDMSALSGAPPYVVLLRCGNKPTSLIEMLLREHAVRIIELSAQSDVICLEIG